MLFDVKPNDPGTFAAAIAVLAVASALAAFVPALRADAGRSLESLDYEIARAMANAATEANPPIAAACNALRHGLAPVNLPLMYPKTSSAKRVTAAEILSASLTLVTKK